MREPAGAGTIACTSRLYRASHRPQSATPQPGRRNLHVARPRMSRILLSAVWLWLLSAPTLAQWPPWAEEAFGGQRRWGSVRPPVDLDNKRAQDLTTAAPSLVDGGPRPQIAPETPPVVAFPYAYPAASIVIDTSARKLYYVLEGRRAYAYAISLGREGFSWTGTEKISRKQEWPDWHPPEEMRQRDPSLPEKMTGG